MTDKDSSNLLPRTLSVQYILNQIGGDHQQASIGFPSSADPKQFLAENGVKILNAKDEDVAKAAGWMVQNGGLFWQRHWSLHPKSGRVKNWMWVHDRYRSQASQLLLPLQESTEMGKLATAFDKLQAKIEKHSEFEDTQLFKFFVDHKIGDPSALAELTEQHTDIRIVKEIHDDFSKLEANATSNEELKKSVLDKISKYVEDLKAHLNLEEQTIVGPWLQLTDDQYKTYRSYLSWKYCFMY